MSVSACHQQNRMRTTLDTEAYASHADRPMCTSVVREICHAHGWGWEPDKRAHLALDAKGWESARGFGTQGGICE
eukprot:10094629-Alexandrium_andersonii.AAC.1